MITILCSFQFKDQSKENAVHQFNGVVTTFVQDYEYVFYADKLFHMQMYDEGFGGYDHQAYYSETSTLPRHIFPLSIERPERYRTGDRCQCGADSIKSKKHSSWCQKYRQTDDS